MKKVIKTIGLIAFLLVAIPISYLIFSAYQIIDYVTEVYYRW
jgi:hypothetical protein